MFLKLLVVLICSACAQVKTPEDSTLDFKGIAEKYGQEAEVFHITTEDGYILKLDHIIGDKRRPVLFVHGLLDTSNGCIIRGNISLAVNVARKGYDVWAINHRGNRYSRRHTILNPDKDPAFWNFYVHEYGSKDLPAAIEFIIAKTGSKVSIIGNSEGVTSVLVLGATRPEYNEKVNVFIGMAPVCFLDHARSNVATVLKLSPHINRGLRSQTEEIFGFHSLARVMMKALCGLKDVGYEICIQTGIFPLTGADPEQFEPDFLPIWISHFPAGCSRKNIYHLAQIGNRKKFAQYHYGTRKNVIRYGSKEPPEYNLSKVTMPVALLMAQNDFVSTMEDVKMLRKKLPNIVDYKVMEYPLFNHIDFIWGKVTYTEVLPHILGILNKYS